MASAMRAPMPSYPGTVLPIHDHPAWKHLSGTTMDTTTVREPPAQLKEHAMVSKKPMIHVPTGNKTLNRFSDITTSTKRSSSVSTTKSQLRQSNAQLLTMLQNIQSELATHRAIMLDVQARLSFIEQDAPTMVDENNAPEILSPVVNDLKPPQRAPPPPPPRRASSIIPPGRESQSWWQACQNFAENCDTPFNASEFLTTPGGQFEDFDFHFGGLTTGGDEDEVIPVPSPIELADTSAPSPVSNQHSPSSPSSVSPSPNTFYSNENAPLIHSLTPQTSPIDTIIEQIIEFKKPTALRPLLLHPPPSGRTASLRSVEEITALPCVQPVDIVMEVQRHKRGVRSLGSRWGSRKGKMMEGMEYRKGFFGLR